MFRPFRRELESLESRENPATTFLDGSYGTDGYATLSGFTSVAKVVELADGSAIAVGTVLGTDGITPDFAVVRLTAAGQPDPTFGTNGLVAVAFDRVGTGQGADVPVDFTVLPGGGIAVLGTAATAVPPITGTGPRLLAVAQLTATGQLDPTFDGDGKLTLSFPTTDTDPVNFADAIGRQADGSLVVAGQVSMFNSTTGLTEYPCYAVRVMATGMLDATYGTAGLASFGAGFLNVAIGPDGRPFALRIDGTTSGTTTSSNAFVNRLDTAGQLDTTYGTAGRADVGVFQTVSIQDRAVFSSINALADGSVIVDRTRAQGSVRSLVSTAYRLTPGGTLNAAFGSGGVTSDFIAGTLVEGVSGRLLGLLSSGLQANANSMVADTSAGQRDTSFGSGGVIDLGAQNIVPLQQIAPPQTDATVLAAVRRSGALAVAKFNAVANNIPTIAANPTSVTYTRRGGIQPSSQTVQIDVNDVETAAANLQLTAVADDAAFFPSGSLVFSGTGATRTLTLTPSGVGVSTFVTVTVRDAAGALASVRLSAIIFPFNNIPPTVVPASSTLAVDQGTTGTLAVTVADANEPTPDVLQVTATTDNPNLFPAGAVGVTGTGGTRTVRLTPAAGQSGGATLQISVRDPDGAETTTTVIVTVRPVANGLPTITSSQSAVTIAAGGAATVQLTVADVETAANDLVVTATADNLTLFPAGSVVVSGTGTTRTLTLTPAAGQSGGATILATVRDAAGGQATATVAVTVTAVPIVPPVPPVPTLVGSREFVVGPDAGGGPVVTFYNPDGTVRRTMSVLSAGFTGGVRVASADFTGDGVADFVVGTGPGTATRVELYDGATYQKLFSVDPFEPSFTGGVFVAAGDLTGDGVAELIITPDEGGGPRVRAFAGRTYQPLADFFGIDDPAFRGGARAAVGDLNGDRVSDLVVGAGFGGGPRVAAYSGLTVRSGVNPVKLFADFFAFEPTLRNGVYPAVGDLDGDGLADLITGAGPGGGPRVLGLSGRDLLSNVYTPLANFFGGDLANRSGIRVAVKNLDGDRRADLIVGPGTGSGSAVVGYFAKNFVGNPAPTADLTVDPFEGFNGGSFVG